MARWVQINYLCPHQPQPNQELFNCPNAKEPARHTLHSTTLLVEDGDEGEAIDDEDTPQWMDDKLMVKTTLTLMLMLTWMHQSSVG